MPEQDPQLERFRQAVERKSEEAREASESTRHSPAEPVPPAAGGGGVQESLVARGTPQDVASARDKNEGHGKKTADKWNQ
jgi:hypothetical protein